MSPATSTLDEALDRLKLLVITVNHAEQLLPESFAPLVDAVAHGLHDTATALRALQIGVREG